YPQLTEDSAFRDMRNFREWKESGARFVKEGTPGAYGGYYTKDEIREVVAYAASKHITVIPEVEMPGHSEEIFAAFPELSCSGKHYGETDLCIGNEKAFEVFQTILDEVIELFPSEYIHIGGDEAEKTSWPTCPKCKKTDA
ncbi:MAG: family 20 glycosylhydrolase, partial [Tannerellaceae bacterium]|nr:family 20 glycosylhydrolase [Tannerellaceae bacterium]